METELFLNAVFVFLSVKFEVNQKPYWNFSAATVSLVVVEKYFMTFTCEIIPATLLNNHPFKVDDHVIPFVSKTIKDTLHPPDPSRQEQTQEVPTFAIIDPKVINRPFQCPRYNRNWECPSECN